MICAKCKIELPEGAKFCYMCGKKQTETSVTKKRSRGNGEGSAYKLPNGKWRAEVVLGWQDGKKIVKTKSGFATKKEALAYIPELRNTPIKSSPNITFAALYDLWSASHYARVSKDTENGYKASYKHCKPLYLLKFADLKTADLQAVVDGATYEKKVEGKWTAVPSGWKSKKEIKNLLAMLYGYALENDYCSKDYAEFIKLPPKPKSTKAAFNDIEISKLWRDYKNGSEFTGYMLIMIYTGMRFGELAKLTKDSVHLDNRYIIGGIKTDAGINREIPICEKIYPIVAKIYERTSEKLLDMHEKVFYNNFYVTLERLGIRKLSPHACRHTFATMMANANIQPAIITATAGHEDYSTTLQYTHIPLEEKLKAVNSL